MDGVRQYVQAIQMVIAAGAHVRMMLRGRSVEVFSVEAGDGCLAVGYITAASSLEQRVAMPLVTRFSVAFGGWPQQAAQTGWVEGGGGLWVN